jgi:hypothetical protein
MASIEATFVPTANRTEVNMNALPAVTMSGVASDEQLGTPAPAKLAEIANGYWLPRCLHIVAELGVADQIASAPVSLAHDMSGGISK